MLESHARAAPESRSADRPRKLQPLDPRRYAWDRSALRPRACPICAGRGRALFLRPDELVLELCDACGTYFVSPAPGEEELARLYRDYHDRLRVEAFRNTKWHARSRLPRVADADLLVAHIRSKRALDDPRIQEIASMLELQGARVLDVGCGTGAFLWSLASLGAEVTGIDVDPVAVGFVRERLGLTSVRCCTLDTLSGGERFDLVALQDIVEHVLRPRELIGQAAALLRPGGLLYLWTPNATFVHREREPLTFRADFEHLQYLQASGVEHLARELGLELLHLESLGYLGVTEDETGPAAGVRKALKDGLKLLPGFRGLNQLRLRLQGRQLERLGTYHLFAVLRRPGR